KPRLSRHASWDLSQCARHLRGCVVSGSTSRSRIAHQEFRKPSGTEPGIQGRWSFDFPGDAAGVEVFVRAIAKKFCEPNLAKDWHGARRSFSRHLHLPSFEWLVFRTDLHDCRTING